LTLLVAANAQGKTSVLEAAYMAATTRSFRSPDPREAIRHGTERFTVFAGLQDGETLAVDRGRQRGDRRLYVGKYEVKLDEYLDYLQALVLTGQSSREIAGSPAERRRSIDRATAAASAGHLPDLGEYRRALSHRNRLLKAEATDAELEPWERILALAGERITARRRQLLEAWQGELGSWPELFPEGRGARLDYRPAGGSGTVLERLQRAREQDRRNGVTGVGPHRDDLQMSVEGVDLWRFGSAGQVRASIAALTLAQVREVRRARRRHTPLLILDDVDTDLDFSRVRALLGAAIEEAQVLAATTKRLDLDDLPAELLSVQDGRVMRD
jgi:DNA replication and repair protein RecF